MKSIKIFLLTIGLLFTWLFTGWFILNDSLSPVARSFTNWADGIIGEYHRDRLPAEVSIFFKLQRADEVRKWEFRSASLKERPISEEILKKHQVLVRVLQLVKEAGLVREPNELKTSKNIKDYLEVKAVSHKNSFHSFIPISEIVKNVKAMNLLVFLRTKNSIMKEEDKEQKV